MRSGVIFGILSSVGLMFLSKKSQTYCEQDQNCGRAAICVLNSAKDSEVRGTVIFNQDSYTSPTKIKGTFEGLKKNGKHGFHIHEFGDNTDGCISAGPHFNPFNKTHGGLDDEERHIGDLGNILSDENGKSTFYNENKLIHLSGKYSIIGRTCVLHADEDDLGRGNFPDSKTTGHSGSRIACGIIGIADSKKYYI